MKNLSAEQVAVIGTSIAVDIAKNRDIDDLSTIINIVGQVQGTLSTIFNQKVCVEKRKK